MKTAILLGASGVTGSALLELLLHDNTINTVKVFARKKINLQHPKLQQFEGDLLHLEQFSTYFTGDVVYCCIGTTQLKTPDKTLYRAIDFGIPIAAATLCEENKIPHFLVISALGANAKSSIFYNRIKAEMEQAVIQKNIPNITIIRPSLIAAKRTERRIGEYWANKIMKVFNPFLIGCFKKYRSITPKTIANALLKLSHSNKGKQIYESEELFKL